MTDPHEISTDKGRKLNWRQASRIIGCGKTQFYDLVNSGKLAAYRLEGCKRGLWVYEADARAQVKTVGEETDTDSKKNDSATHF